MEILNVLSLKIYSGELKDYFIKEKTLINTISPNSYAISLKDPEFRAALQGSTFLILDGLYFVLAPLLLKGKYVKKISGTDCFYHYMAGADKENKKVFFLGSTEDTLLKIKSRASLDCPNAVIGYYSPPFKEKYTNEENDRIVSSINSFNPDILFVGMTAPKQEKWSFINKDKINARLICTVGNVFDWYAGNQKQPEKIWVNLGLEWLIRTIRRPEILKRYPNVFKFFWILFLNIIRIRKD